MQSKKWYRKSALFSTDPFGSSELSDKTRVAPGGAMGGDTHTGAFEASDGNHHANDTFSESGEIPSIEKSLTELKKKIDKKRRDRSKRRRLKKTYADKHVSVRVAQWGSGGGKLPLWEPDDWVSKTYQEISGDESGIQPPTTGQNDAPDQINDILASVVMIERTKGEEVETGSGFFINDNVILTCSHVAIPKDGNLEGTSIVVSNKQGKFAGYVWAFDPALDIAAIVINDKNFKKGVSLQLGNSSQMKVGEEILVVGSPMGFENIVTKGIISSGPMNVNEGQNQPNYIFISSNIHPGNSGGPVLKGGEKSVVGIVAAVVTPNEQTESGLSATIPIDSTKPFMKKNGIKFKFQG